MVSPKAVFCQRAHSTDTHKSLIGARLYAELCVGRREGEERQQRIRSKIEDLVPILEQMLPGAEAAFHRWALREGVQTHPPHAALSSLGHLSELPLHLSSGA